MNHAKWEATRSTSMLVIKLAEETGEVAKAHLDVQEARTEGQYSRAQENLMEEIDHVIFIAGRLKELHGGR